MRAILATTHPRCLAAAIALCILALASIDFVPMESPAIAASKTNSRALLTRLTSPLGTRSSEGRLLSEATAASSQRTWQTCFASNRVSERGASGARAKTRGFPSATANQSRVKRPKLNAAARRSRVLSTVVSPLLTHNRIGCDGVLAETSRVQPDFPGGAS
jgi:hypothetical protein